MRRVSFAFIAGVVALAAGSSTIASADQRYPAGEPRLEAARGAPLLDHARYGERHNLRPGFASALWDRTVGVPRRMWGAGVAVPRSTSSAATATQFARDRLAKWIDLLAPGAAPQDFVLIGSQVSGGIRTVGFDQRFGDLPVEGGQISFRFKHDRLVMVASEALPNVSVRRRAAVDRPVAAAAALRWIRRDLAQDPEIATVDDPVVLPLLRRTGLEYAIAVPVEIVSSAPPGRWRVYVDASSGKPLARMQTLSFGGGTLTYDVPVRHPDGGRTVLPANRASLIIDGASATTSIDGALTWPTTEPASVTATASGPQVRVQNDAGAEASTSFSIPDGGTFTWNAAANEQVDAQLSAFIHASAAIEHARVLDDADLAFLDQQLPVVVNFADECNAFSDGASLTFFAASATCHNTARLADIVYHEFGHALHFNALIEGVGEFDVPLSEGLSDYFSASITGDPAIAPHFFLAGDAPLRHIDPVGDEAVWPDDISDDPHTTGLILSGALWDLRKALVEAQGGAGGEITDHLFYEAMRRAVDIPSTYQEVLLADDDDGNLANGTPNGCLIDPSFEAHGLVAGSDRGCPGPVNGCSATPDQCQPPPPTQLATGQRAAAVKHCKKKFPGRAKAPKRKKCIKRAKRRPL
jgi:hypothetical protein